MTFDDSAAEYRIHYLATLFCGAIGLAGVIGEIVCRALHIDGPLSFTTLTGVCIGALAGAVPGALRNGRPHQSPT